MQTHPKLGNLVGSKIGGRLSIRHHAMRALILFLVGVLVSGCQDCHTPALTQLPPTQADIAHERFLVMEASLRYMFDKYPDDKVHPHFSAYVLDRGEFSNELVEAFRGYKPAVTASVETVMSDSYVLVDKATRLPVKGWSVEVRELQGDRAVAFVTWITANTGGGGHAIQLRRQDGQWVVESEKVEWNA